MEWTLKITQNGTCVDCDRQAASSTYILDTGDYEMTFWNGLKKEILLKIYFKRHSSAEVTAVVAADGVYKFDSPTENGDLKFNFDKTDMDLGLRVCSYVFDGFKHGKPIYLKDATYVYHYLHLKHRQV